MKKGLLTPVPDTLDVKIWDKIKDSFQLDKKINLSYDVKNTQRAIGTRLSHYLLIANLEIVHSRTMLLL